MSLRQIFEIDEEPFDDANVFALSVNLPAIDDPSLGELKLAESARSGSATSTILPPVRFEPVACT